jgi:Flp pilus assembly protein TadG
MRLVDRPARRGGVALELLFVLPILLAVLLGAVEFSLWLTAQQQVNLAAREGARAAATGGTLDDVNAAVKLALGARFDKATVQAQLTDAGGNPLPPGQPVTVAVALPATAVVPDLLAFVGLSVRNVSLVGQTVMRKE